MSCNQAYRKPSPEVIDLTLDDDSDSDELTTAVSESVLETARALDEFLASDHEETMSDSEITRKC